MSVSNRKPKRFFKAAPQLRTVLTISGLLLLVFTAMSLYSATYGSIRNVSNLIVQCIPIAIVSLGQTLVIISGGIDLSLGATISLTTVIAAKLMNTDSPAQIAFAILAILLVSSIIGLINGLGVNGLKVPPLITTLCVSNIVQGSALLLLPVAGGKVNPEFAAFVMRKWGLVSMPLVILAGVYIVIHFVLYRNRLGTHLYAIGKNRNIASSMGINSSTVSVKAYVIAALCAAVTGLILASRMRIGDPIVGSAYSMDAITASVIGGTSLSGGVGLISGSVTGAFLVGMLSNAMNILGVNQFYQYVLKGSLLIIAMILYSLSHMLEGKRNV